MDNEEIVRSLRMVLDYLQHIEDWLIDIEKRLQQLEKQDE